MKVWRFGVRGDMIASSLHVAHVVFAVDVTRGQDTIQITCTDLTGRCGAGRTHMTALQGERERKTIW